MSGSTDTAANRARRLERTEIDLEAARDLDAAAREYVAARALTVAALRRLVIAARLVGEAVMRVRPLIRMPFAKWCLANCKLFNPGQMRGVCAMASRTHQGGQVETWMLRMLGVVLTVHHTERPAGQRRQVKPLSFIGHITRTKEGVARLIEQRGGIDKLTDDEKAVIGRQLGALDELRQKVTRPSHG